MTENCEHKWWALTRVVEGAEPVLTKRMVSGRSVAFDTLPVEVYGKRCAECGAEIMLDDPIRVKEQA